MSDAPYDIRTLSRLAKVTPRTVHFYVQQGLLPPAGSTGPGARYDEDHLLRLRVIRRLQRRHLPLAEIRRRLGGLGAADLSRLLEESDERARPARSQSALEYVRSVLKREDDRAASPRPAPAFSMPRAWLGVGDGDRARPNAALHDEMVAGLAVPTASEPSVPVERSQWNRVTLAPDVELHVRRPLSRDMNRRVDRLIVACRVILEED